MGPKLAPKCAHCQTGTSDRWHTVEKGVQLCGGCHERQEREQQELERELEQIQAGGPHVPSPVKQEVRKEEEVVPTLVDVAAAAQQVEGEKVEEGARKELEASCDLKEEMKDEVKEEMGDDKDEKESNGEGGKEKPMPSLSPRKLRKNVRSARKGGPGSAGGNGSKTGRSRRFIFKKHPMKAPTITVTTRTVETLFHNNIYFQIGDIVSVMDAQDNIYYAQIHGLQIDSYCEKTAYITWLIPTTSSPPPNERFDPSTYLIGPEEDLPRKLSCMEFVMHAPSSYYLDRNNPYPRPDTWGPENTSKEDNSNYIWANISHLYQC
uniref:GATA zinc finger domain-containing protein 1 n=1 Tax=Culex pipiens TaxID=7175 RepID=A0A8D8PB87_CULPI